MNWVNSKRRSARTLEESDIPSTFDRHIYRYAYTAYFGRFSEDSTRWVGEIEGFSRNHAINRAQLQILNRAGNRARRIVLSKGQFVYMASSVSK